MFFGGNIFTHIYVLSISPPPRWFLFHPPARLCCSNKRKVDLTILKTNTMVRLLQHSHWSCYGSKDSVYCKTRQLELILASFTTIARCSLIDFQWKCKISKKLNSFHFSFKWQEGGPRICICCICVRDVDILTHLVRFHWPMLPIPIKRS